MSEMYGQTEKALSTAAEYVEQARGEVKGKCNTLSSRVQEMMSGWGGQGASAFGTLMVTWQEKQETILKAMDQLALSLRETEKDNVSTDEAQSATTSMLTNRLG